MFNSPLRGSYSISTSLEIENELASIKELYSAAISTAKEMKTDIYGLIDIIKEMNGAIDAVSSISAQTNLLALNASIEAARAGESGKLCQQ